MDFEVVRCVCGSVVMDAYAFRGVVRPICPGCKRRVTVHGDGQQVKVTQVGQRPSKLPRGNARVAA